ncbi:leucine zipper transcription factor-like protein 1 [Folsomia candida]|uniref:leucine zipper transcription factor-like protein 1 n=1 Tax=Folsomia candida TaxID=158441 RepID=UPI001604ED92|nr:leucine zipper transcription factor-like protein 1 [Folsomia candida]
MENNKHIKLNEIHCDLISEYLRFCKYQTGQRLKSIDYCFSSILNCRVRSTETYTGDEVKSLLTDLEDVVRGEVDTELTDGVHTNTLFVQQLLAQAEEWHLTLSANISELENRELLNCVKLFEEEQQRKSESQKMSITVTQTKQVIPVEDMNVATALKTEIARLTMENDSLRTHVANQDQDSKNPPPQSVDVQQLESELSLAQGEINRLKSQLHSLLQENESDSMEKLQIVQQAVDTLSKELEVSQTKAAEETEKLKRDLESREDKLRQIQSNLLLAEKELDKKFQATSAYMNMKKILVQKNNQIKSLRRKVASLGGTEGGDDEESEEDGIALQKQSNLEEEGFRI